MPPLYKYFTPEEVEGLNEDFVAKLDLARKFAGIPFTITSGLRTVQENESLVASGAVPDSAHLQGNAVDLRVANNHEVYLIIAAGVSVGITRYGIYLDSEGIPTHVHLDTATDRVSEVIWIKREGKPNSAPATA